VAAVLERSVDPLPQPARGLLSLRRLRALLPLAIAVLNALAFMIVRPGVDDLWAARARADAVGHGVGLTYWFSWFGGGTTPGNYSVISPYLSALLSPELVGALSTVLITPLCALLFRGTRYPLAGVTLATGTAGLNLWAGRVPFALGCAFAIGALLAVKAQRRAPAVLLTLLSVFASPVSGAFLALGVAGSFFESKTHRAISATTMATVVFGLGVVALAFGAPGPEHISYALFGETIASFLLFLLARPPAYLRTAIYLSIIVDVVLVLVPNGMGSNFGRWSGLCLPVAVLATSGRRLWIAVLATVPAVVIGAGGTVSDLRDAGDPVSKAAYYKPLAVELDRLEGLANYRLEVVNHGAHAADAALLDHAMLARGWETQEDNALNRSLLRKDLDPTSYKIWLDNNSVGYVALPRAKTHGSPEYALVEGGNLKYLTVTWTGADWVLYRVVNPNPIVAPPQRVVEYSQSRLTIRVPCVCTFSVRVRWSKFLRARSLADKTPARVVDDGYGYTSVTTTVSGDYVLQGTVTKIFH